MLLVSAALQENKVSSKSVTIKRALLACKGGGNLLGTYSSVRRAQHKEQKTEDEEGKSRLRAKLVVPVPKATATNKTGLLCVCACVREHARPFFSVTYGVYTTESFSFHFIQTDLFSFVSDQISFTAF